LPPEVAGGAQRPGAPASAALIGDLIGDRSGNLSLARAEREHILRVLQHAEGNKTRAAELLGITRLTLRNKLREYGVPAERGDGGVISCPVRN